MIRGLISSGNLVHHETISTRHMYKDTLKMMSRNDRLNRKYETDTSLVFEGRGFKFKEAMSYLRLCFNVGMNQHLNRRLRTNNVLEYEYDLRKAILKMFFYEHIEGNQALVFDHEVVAATITNGPVYKQREKRKFLEDEPATLHVLFASKIDYEDIKRLEHQFYNYLKSFSYDVESIPANK